MITNKMEVIRDDVQSEVDVENIVPKNMNDIDPVIMLVYITLIIPLICALIYAF